MNQNEVNLILSRLDSIESNQLVNQKRTEDWISKIETNNSARLIKIESKLIISEKNLSNVKLKVTGIVSFMGIIVTLTTAWIERNIFH